MTCTVISSLLPLCQQVLRSDVAVVLGSEVADGVIIALQVANESEINESWRQDFITSLTLLDSLRFTPQNLCSLNVTLARVSQVYKVTDASLEILFARHCLGYHLPLYSVNSGYQCYGPTVCCHLHVYNSNEGLCLRDRIGKSAKSELHRCPESDKTVLKESK